MWPQVVAAFVVNLNTFILGASMAWPAMALPQLLDTESGLLETPLTTDEGSWVATLLPLAGAFVIPVGTTISSHFGCKTLAYGTVVPLLASWIIKMTSTSVTALYVARILSGMHAGCGMFLPSTYVGETASPQVRGALASLLPLFSNSGYLFSYVIGAYLPYDVVLYVHVVPIVIFVVAFLFVPETPYRLLSFHRPQQARQALCWLRRGITDQQLEAEVASIQASLDRGASKAVAGEPSPAEHLRSRAALLALTIVLVISVNQQFCGSFAVVSYAVFIFQEAGGSVSAEVATIIIGVLQIAGGLFSMRLIERLGRRFLLFTSNASVGLTVAVLGAYFYLKAETQVDLSAVGWLPVTCLSIYVLMVAFGLGPLPYVMLSELVAPRIRGFAATAGCAIISGAAAAMVKLYTPMSEAMGTYGTFWFFAGVCAIGSIIEWFMVPETKGRSLEDILRELNGCKKNQDGS